MHQKQYIDKLRQIGTKQWKEFASLRAKLTWTVHTRPDIARGVAQSAQITREQLDKEGEESVSVLNRNVRKLQKTVD